MKLYHPEIDVYDEQPDRKAKHMIREGGWEPVDALPEDKAEEPDPHVEHPDDPAVESITYSEAELKKQAKTKAKASK